MKLLFTLLTLSKILKDMNYPKVVILLMLVACTQQAPQSQSPSVTEAEVLGTWLNESLHITYVGRDSVYEVPADSWEASLNIKPIETIYKDDYTFVSNYYSLKDSLVGSNQGRWELKGDSLGLTSEGVTTWYLFTVKDNKGTFEGMLDWDQDGQPNELYRGVQVKQ